ncbi:MAG: class I SAM-dependent methyltransferase [Candidatus Electrothrix sp. YB6]
MPLSKYTKSSAGVWTRAENSAFNYCDGVEIEERLLQQIQEAADVSVASDELQRLMVDWPSEYHFSPLRANLLSSFQLHQFPDILEVGSGCGAITRALGEQCPDSGIIALEGSRRRAEITKARCRDLANVEVYQDAFADFAPSYAFDLITMIGVLEYSPSFFAGDDPIVDALQHARNLLSDNGVLVIAIENQLGLKYFNGCGEDHNGQPFFGLNDWYRPGTSRTFGRRELQQLFSRAGFDRLEFVYPFPDYKLPQLLVREEAIQGNELDCSRLVAQYPSRDYSRNVDKMFIEARIWKTLSCNGLLRDLANSFLVFAFPDEKALADITDPWLVKAFSCRRKKRHLVETVFRKEENEIIVEKRLSYSSTSDQTEAPEGIRHHVGQTEYIDGIPYVFGFLGQAVLKDTLAYFVSYLTPWVDWLRKHVCSQTTTAQGEILLVPGSLYDGIPANFLINREKQLCLIDQEWEYREPLELGFVLFRGVYRELSTNLDFLEQTDLIADGTFFDVLVRIYDAFGLLFDRDVFAAYIEREVDFQLELCSYSADRDSLVQYLNDFFTKTRLQKSGIAGLLVSGGTAGYALLKEREKTLRQTVAERDEQIDVLNQQVRQRDEKLSEIFRSQSWRLMAPLRFAGYLIRGDFAKASAAVKKMKLWISTEKNDLQE